ncbi:MAG: cyclic nucleotide-binding domain-containing protein [Magnetococcales bacterium]|nr:cyclic nucleotide-binding domain-containing protein [Magnetococcales bacterium]MBF0157254.1 cyclic nucleotide-binding domain-containing protein [Magnetococcales bacterium]
MKKLPFPPPAELAGQLQRLTSLEGMTRDDWLRLLEQVDHVALYGYRMGEFLIREGDDQDRCLLILLSGSASVVKSGSSIPLATLTPGDFFGEIAFLTNRVRTTNVIVHAPVAPAVGGEVGAVRRMDESAVVFRMGRGVLGHLPAEVRERLKDAVIGRLFRLLDSMTDQVIRLTGEAPEFLVDTTLATAIQAVEGENKGQTIGYRRTMATLSRVAREDLKDRFIERLADYLSALNQRMADY